MLRKVSYTEKQAREAVEKSHSFSEALRYLNLRASGRSLSGFQTRLKAWSIDHSHFDRYYHCKPENPNRRTRGKIPLDEILRVDSKYSRTTLKRRLYEEGVITPICELCGQDENWQGKKMALILDHINGINNDNRIENLQIVCPNCNATLDTHCGKNIQYT